MRRNEFTTRQVPEKVPAGGRLLFSLLDQLHQGQLDIWAPGGQMFSFSGKLPGPQADIHLKDWRVLDDAVRTGDIGFAQAYVDGRWHTSNLSSLLELLAINRPCLEKILHGKWWAQWIYRMRHAWRANTRERAKKNIHAHYDLGNAFYRAWLDETMTYSAAIFDNAAARTLEQAQIAKYERILRRLNVSVSTHVLEIGCGWGGFAEYAARTRGCRVTAITLSAAQLEFARRRIESARLSPLVEFSLTDYRDVQGSFDCVVSIEMFEAVGEEYWPAYFSAVHNRLKRGGRALIQTITIADELFAHYRKSTDFIQHYIFPGGMLPSVAVFRAMALRAGFEIRDELRFGVDYAHTLMHWRNRYKQAIYELRRLGFDERFDRLWNFYLAYCEAGFRVANTDVMQVELARA